MSFRQGKMLLCFFIPIPNPIHFSLGLEAKIKKSFIPMRGGRESSTGHVSVADWVLSCFCPKVRSLDKAVGERIKRQRLQWTWLQINWWRRCLGGGLGDGRGDKPEG